jgi:hypothetical protein
LRSNPAQRRNEDVASLRPTKAVVQSRPGVPGSSHFRAKHALELDPWLEAGSRQENASKQQAEAHF